MRGPPVRSTSSDIARKVGSSSRPDASARAAAASRSSAMARNSGLSCRPSASTLSTIVPGTAATSANPGAAGASASPAISSSRRDATTALILLRELDGDAAAYRLSLPLHLGGKRQHPAAGHAGLDLEQVDPR